MKREELIDVLANFSSSKGAPGFEDEVIKLVKAYFPQASTDRMGNCSIKFGQAKSGLSIHLDAHLDEVGLMSQSILASGLVKVIPLGGWVTSNLPSSLFELRNRAGDYVPAVACSKPPHFLSAREREQKLSFDDILLDVGASSKKEAEAEFQLAIGEPAVPKVKFSYNQEQGLVRGKAFDCRIGCTALAATIWENLDSQHRIHACFSVQEEVGTRGATAAISGQSPDLAIVFEGCPADDSFAGEASQTALGKGPMLRYIDARMITHPRFQRYSLDLAAKQGIPVQAAVRTGGSTNAAPIHLSQNGVPSIVIGVPVRYIHSHHGLAKVIDLENSIKLASAILADLDRAKYEELISY